MFTNTRCGTRSLTCAIVALTIVTSLAGPAAQVPQGDEAAWQAFMAWFKSAPPVRTNPFAAYAASLKAAGAPESEARRQVGVLMAMLRERSDWVELYYDKIYTIPLTGDPASDGFTTDPSAIVVEAVKGLAPGTALDAGMGQGRNAVYLARQGWRVTGFDVSAEALKAARANTAAAGVQIETVKASYADFDYGTARWDVIVLVFAWAPVDDPGSSPGSGPRFARAGESCSSTSPTTQPTAAGGDACAQARPAPGAAGGFPPGSL